VLLARTATLSERGLLLLILFFRHYSPAVPNPSLLGGRGGVVMRGVGSTARCSKDQGSSRDQVAIGRNASGSSLSVIFIVICSRNENLCA